MNLTGHWKGTYTYGRGYPENLIGESEPFEFVINEVNGLFTGTCIDNVVKEKQGNESFIEGDFKAKKIRFKKKYKYHLALDESNSLVQQDDIKSDGVDYAGRLYRKFFFGKRYFSGQWRIITTYKENNRIRTYTCGGRWRMNKVNY